MDDRNQESTEERVADIIRQMETVLDDSDEPAATDDSGGDRQIALATPESFPDTTNGHSATASDASPRTRADSAAPTEPAHEEQQNPSSLFDDAFDDEDALEEFTALLAEAHPISWGEVAATLVDELRHDAPSDVILKDLQAELTDLLGAGSTGAEPIHLEVRLERLESTVASLDAYTDALEEFLDEDGAGRDVLEALEARVAGLEADLAGLQATVGTLHDQQVAADRVGALEETLDELTAHQLPAIEERTTALDERVGQTEQTLATVVDRLNELDSSVADVDGQVANLSSAVATQQTGLEEVATECDELRDQTATLEGRVTSLGSRLDERDTELRESLEGVEATVAEQQSAIEELKATQQAILKAFKSASTEASETQGTAEPSESASTTSSDHD